MTRMVTAILVIHSLFCGEKCARSAYRHEGWFTSVHLVPLYMEAGKATCLECGASIE